MDFTVNLQAPSFQRGYKFGPQPRLDLLFFQVKTFKSMHQWDLGILPTSLFWIETFIHHFCSPPPPPHLCWCAGPSPAIAASSLTTDSQPSGTSPRGPTILEEQILSSADTSSRWHEQSGCERMRRRRYSVTTARLFCEQIPGSALISLLRHGAFLFSHWPHN